MHINMMHAMCTRYSCAYADAGMCVCHKSWVAVLVVKKEVSMALRKGRGGSAQFEYLIRELKVLSPGYLKIAESNVKHRGPRISDTRQVQHYPKARQRGLRRGLESSDQRRQTRSGHQESTSMSI